MSIPVRNYEPADWHELVRLALALFPEYPAEEVRRGIHSALQQPGFAYFVAARDSGTLAGYVQVGTRAYADGCDSSPVGYVEEWYVDEDVRRGGVGRALLHAAEEWARSRGYTEMASDALLDNLVSHQAHEAAGYEEVERAVRFRKQL